jgi:uracil phosphoribosyltransferase
LALHIVDHPLARHYLTHLRDGTTSPALFRTLTGKLTTMLAVEATRSLRTESISIRTPLEEIDSEALAEDIVIVPILRAGLGMVEPIVALLPDVSVGYFGIERDEETAQASAYYYKLPPVAGKTVILVDPMLATGGTARWALKDLYALEPDRVVLICVVAAPEGLAVVEHDFPRLEIFTAALDRELNSRKYILPGLGDFGDRLYGTF